MPRRWITIGLLIFCAGAIAFSQGAKIGGEARQLAMGGSSAALGIAANPFITQDPVFILVNPAYIMNYGNYAWWNIGGGMLNNLSTGDNGYGQQNVGLSFNVTRDLVVGGTFSYDPSAVNTVAAMLKGGTALGPLPFAFPGFIPGTEARGGGITGAQTIPGVQNVWEALAALRVGPMNLGFGFMYGSSNSDASSSSPGTSFSREASAHMFGVRGGLLMDLGAGSVFDAHVAFRSDNATDNVKFNPVVPTNGGEYSASGTELELGARLRLRLSNKFNFVPYAAFTTVSGEPKQDAPRNTIAALTSSQKFTATALAIGAGGEYKISNFYLAGGVSYQMLKGKLELSETTPAPGGSTTSTLTYTSVPTFNLGAEWWLTDWLAARAGYFRMLGSINSKTESSAGTSSSSSESNLTTPLSLVVVGGIGPASWDGVVTLGMGFRFGSFSLDATVSDEALRRGLGLLGSADNINTFGYMTASYNFE